MDSVSSDREVAILARIDAAVEAEQGRWQTAIYERLVKSVGEDARIDGAGCDSGDPLDLTLSEISQAVEWLRENPVVAG